ncbi:MAG: hypothetical protein IBX62_07625 [Coriobacteriia bacterium]|nr:hypothetical protein [Coriobacteriia bacterium]
MNADTTRDPLDEPIEARAETEAETAAPEGVLRRGLTPRQAFGMLAGVLAALLIALIVYLLLTLAPESLTLEGGDTVAGLEPVLVIQGPGKGPAPRFDRPMSAAFGPRGRIYVSDTGNNRVCVFDRRGDFLFEFGGFGVGKPIPGVEPTWKEGLMNFPVGIDVDEDGTVYVADFRNDQIQAFDAEGNFLRAFPDRLKPVGRGGSGQDGGGIAVTDVAVRDGKVYATDTYQVFVFTTDGKLVRQFGKPGSGIGDLDHPNGVAVGADGTIFVSDSNHNRVTAFDSEGTPLWDFGRPLGMARLTDPATRTDDADEAEEGLLGLPRGLTVDDEGRLLVADAFDFQLVLIGERGRTIERFGERGTAPGQLNFLNDVDVDGDLLLVADKENDRVQLVRLVRTVRP